MRFIAKLTVLTATIVCAAVAGLAQEKLRRVEQPPLYQYKNTPVAVVVKLDDREMVDRKAMAGPDWLHRLSLDVTNTSGKDIKELRINLILRDGQASIPRKVSVLMPLELINSHPKTNRLLPGELTTLKPAAAWIDRWLDYLKNEGTVDVEQVILDINDVEFTDGTRWLIGDLLRFDSESGRYKKVEQTVQQDVKRLGETRTIRFTDPIWSERVPLETLAAESTLIAIGVTTSNVCVTSAGPQAVDTVYQIRVTEIIRGNSGLNGLEVIMPGGLVREASGGLLMSQTPGLQKMGHNRKYILFLRPSDEKGLVLTPIRGAQGVFELPAEGNRVFHLGSAFEPPENVPQLEQNIFLHTVRQFRSN